MKGGSKEGKTEKREDSKEGRTRRKRRREGIYERKGGTEARKGGKIEGAHDMESGKERFGGDVERERSEHKR